MKNPREFSTIHSVHSPFEKIVEMIYSGENNGLTHFQATRRKFVVEGLLATAGVAGLLADFLYGGPIRNALYPQSTTRGQEMASLTKQVTESSSANYSTSSQTYTKEGRLFFDKGTSQYGTAGNGVQDDADSEPGLKDVKVLFLDLKSNVAATSTTDSSGDFNVDLPKGYFYIYPVTDKFPYMCKGVDGFARISDGYIFAVSESNPKLSVGLLQGFLSYPEKGIDLDGGYYDRDPRKGYTLAWNGATDESADNDSGTHFLAEEGDIIPSFAPGIVTGVFPNEPDNWVVISTNTSPSFDIGFAHNSEVLVSVGQGISRYQPIAKAGHRGYTNHTLVHLQLATQTNYGYEILDPYKPVYPINPNTYGCWTPLRSCTGDCKNVDWLPLPKSQNDNWQNYWIVEDQTHF